MFLQDAEEFLMQRVLGSGWHSQLNYAYAKVFIAHDEDMALVAGNP